MHAYWCCLSLCLVFFYWWIRFLRKKSPGHWPCNPRVQEIRLYHSRGTCSLSWQHSKGQHDNHGVITDILKRSYKISCQSGLYRSARGQTVSILPWKSGKVLMWDTTCPDTLYNTPLRHGRGKNNGRKGIEEEKGLTCMCTWRQATFLSHTRMQCG